MNPIDPQEIERQILLHSSQELPANQAASLAAHLAQDAEGTAFAKFLHEELPAAAKAPRDFAAIAIAAAAPKVLWFPHFRKLAAAAAVVFLAANLVQPKRPQLSPIQQAGPRVTAHLSTRLDVLESELEASSLRLAQRHRPRNLKI